MDPSNDQPEKCSRCHEFPEDILMLTCNHDLCLLCAATVFTAPENQIHRSNNELRCEQCASLTQLDQSSIFELEKLMPVTRMKQSMQPKIQSTATPQQQPQQIGFQGSQTSDILQKYKIYDYQPQPLTSSLAAVSQQQQSRYQEKAPLNTLMGSASKKQKQYCSVHTDEKISYFCYDCQINICPECVIHGYYYNIQQTFAKGTHKDHDVGTVKKAYPVIVRKLEERIDQVSEKIKDTKSFQEKFNQRKIEILDTGRQKKKQIQDAFHELRIMLDKKEKELLDNQQRSEQEFMKFLEIDFNIISQKLQQFKSDIDAIALQINQKDQISLLNFYAQQNKTLEQTAQNDEQFFTKIQGDYEESQRKKTFDSNIALSQLNQMLQQIQTNDPQQDQWNGMNNSSDFGMLNQSSEMKQNNQQYGNKYIPDSKSNQSGKQSFIHQNY